MSNEPNFLYIGPDKSGSSWLFELLANNPGIFVPACKDIYYFDKYYHFGEDWYKSFFSSVKGESAIGEISHDYLFCEAASKRIRKFNPEMKLITFLRDPIDRTFSHYLYLLRSGMTKKPIIEAVKDYPELIDNSNYAKHLKKYQWAFDNKLILVKDFSELRNSEELFAKEIIDFLDVDLEHVELPGVVREASKARSYYLSKLIKFLAVKARALGFGKFVGHVKTSFVSRVLFKEYGNNKPGLADNEKDYLLSLFRDQVKELKDSYPYLNFDWVERYE